MTHKRETVRKNIAAQLAAAEIVASGLVFQNRRLSVLDSDQLPAINVYTGDEESSPLSLSQKTLRRDLRIEIEVAATTATPEDLDDTLDDLAEEIEAALRDDAIWAGETQECTLVSTARIEPEQDGEKPTAGLRLSYTARYYS